MSRGKSFERIMFCVASSFGISALLITGKGRTREVVAARHAFFHLCLEQLPSAGLREIGHYCGGRDHSTVIHGCKRVEAWLDEPDYYRIEMEMLENAREMILDLRGETPNLENVNVGISTQWMTPTL